MGLASAVLGVLDAADVKQCRGFSRGRISYCTVCTASLKNCVRTLMVRITNLLTIVIASDEFGWSDNRRCK
eukprot:1907677-Pyramimonas_sp.AAC.1